MAPKLLLLLLFSVGKDRLDSISCRGERERKRRKDIPCFFFSLLSKILQKNERPYYYFFGVESSLVFGCKLSLCPS